MPRRRLRDRFVGGLARSLARGFYRSVEVVGTPPDRGPIILAASHLNGFVDPLLLVSKLKIFPRFLAKATLWDVRVAGPLLNFLGVIPVYRREDGAGPTDNLGTFDAAVSALEQDATVAIFPEGTTHDDAKIRPIRTGVARIAVEAVAAGVHDLRIIPVGVAYEDKVSVRGRAIVHFGEPVVVPSEHVLLDEQGQPVHEVVRTLTDEIQSAIEDVTPTFASTEEALALGSAAQITLRTEARADRPVPMAESAAIARRLSRVRDERSDALVDQVARYQMRLGFVGLRDQDLSGDGLRRIIRTVVWLSILVVLLAPIALAGLFINLAPALLVILVGLIPSAPVTKGTVRVLVAAVAFPLTWIVVAATDAQSGWLGALDRSISAPASFFLGQDPGDRTGAIAALVVLVLAPISGLVAVFLAERFWVLLRSILAWWTFVSRRGQLAEVRDRRREVVEATNRILDGRR